MAFLVNEASVDIINDKAVDIRSSLPIGIYKVSYSQFRGVFLENTDFKLEHGKIYGHADEIASHIVDAYKKFSSNLGVILSGGKGLGKSLTARLVVEKVMKKYPVIIINEYIPTMFDCLSSISNAVIIIDEFEKTMKGHIDGSDNHTDAKSKQEDMLTFLDGTAVASHNLVLMTVNNVFEVDDFLRSRPGRIKYHYRYESIDEKTIRAYCADNLKKPKLEDDIVNELLATRYVSLDIVRALVDEVNAFDVSVSDALGYLNVEINRINVSADIILEFPDGKVETRTYRAGHFATGISALSFEIESSGDEDDEQKSWCFDIEVPMAGKTIPLTGSIDVSASARICWKQYSDIKPVIKSIKLYDSDSKQYSSISNYYAY